MNSLQGSVFTTTATTGFSSDEENIPDYSLFSFENSGMFDESKSMLLPEEFRTLFLGDLSIHCTRQDILQLFLPFGSIERITLKVGAAMKGLGYGFISFTERESAEKAMEWMQGTILLGRAMRVSWATPRGQTHLINKEPSKTIQQTAEVHFSFLTKQTHFIVTEEIIRHQYEKFGEILDVVIKRTKMNHKQAYQNGYGFVRYPLTSEGIQGAIDATKYMHQVQIDGINYDTHLTHALETLLERISPEILREYQRRTSRAPPQQRQPSQFPFPSPHPMLRHGHYPPKAPSQNYNLRQPHLDYHVNTSEYDEYHRFTGTRELPRRMNYDPPSELQQQQHYPISVPAVPQPCAGKHVGASGGMAYLPPFSNLVSSDAYIPSMELEEYDNSHGYEIIPPAITTTHKISESVDSSFAVKSVGEK